jgi:cobalt-precorrin 5A hydrolase
MKIIIISFTKKGYELSERLSKSVPHDIQLIFKGRDSSCDQSLTEICGDAFEKGIALVFIGAAGIAVRSIAEFVRDKLKDPPVIVIDETGSFVIPVLSGHMGGANELALEIASASGAVPVITTATDINGAFSVDLFAKENGLSIADREGIARVSSTALEGRPVTISIKDYPPKEPVDVLISDEVMPGFSSIRLCPKKYALGIGCRRGKSFSELRAFAEKVLEEHGIDISDVGAVATIDIKKDEEGIVRLSEYLRAPLITFEASVLARVPGSFSSSERVLRAVGVDNVCERAAAAAAGRDHELAVKKTAADGMTIAVALRKSQAGN